VVLRRECNDGLGGHRHRLLAIIGQEGHERFGQVRQLPARDVWLVREGIASPVVDRAERGAESYTR